jgi:CCR4-NOT transcriptional regulation complex NOT5 subunit
LASKTQFNGVGRLRTYISFTHSAFSESSTMDCDHSKLKGTVFGIHDWLNYLQDQAAKYRKLIEQADDPFVKTELLALASVCEEIADNIEDHLTGGEDQAPRGPLSRLS